MSRSNPTAKNPASRFMQWAGGVEGGGQVTYYDKEAQENKIVPLPFSFLVLDELTTITGYSKADRSGFWSNEVRDLKTGELVVRTKAGIKARGTYAQISDEIKAAGGKYAKSVYIAFKDETGELVIGNMKIFGAALTAWIEFNKKFDIEKCAVIVSGATEAKNGATTYFVPVFEGRNVSEATDNAAKALDEVVQSYLGTYLTRKLDETETAQVVDEPTAEADVEIKDLDADDLPAASAPQPAAKAEAAKPAAAAQPAADDKINLADVPF